MAQESGATASSAPPTLLVTCDRCGDVVIEVRSAWVARWGHGRYGFACPACRARRVVDAPEHVLGVLLHLGAHELLADWSTQDDDPAGPPLTVDDLLDLTAQLAATDFVAGNV
jgi:hypothetical protein